MDFPGFFVVCMWTFQMRDQAVRVLALEQWAAFLAVGVDDPSRAVATFATVRLSVPTRSLKHCHLAR